MHPGIAICFVFLGCGSNNVFLELIVREIPGSGTIITFLQFFLIGVEGFIFTSKFGTKKPVIPLKCYGQMVLMFFVVSVVNNMVFIFNISMPLQMIFRSGTLASSMVLGVILLKRQYKVSKYLAVIIISIGIILCTLASANQVEYQASHTGDVGYDYFMWICGICTLVFGLFMTSYMGIYQEKTYTEYGKHPRESLFYNHALPLPLFLLLSKDIYNKAVQFSQSEPVLLPMLAVSIPKQWLYIICNSLTQYVCIRSVFVLTTECTSLTLTLVLTLRKFASIMFSIYYFENPFTIYHWIGSVLVFVGTLLFTEIISIDRFFEKKKKSA